MSFWQRRYARFADAGRGVLHVLVKETHGRVHVLAAAVAVVVAAVTRLAPAEWAILMLTIGAVIGAEAFNSALEQLADAVHPGHHPGVGRAKDMAAGAVLVAATTAAVVGGLIFLPRLFG